MVAWALLFIFITTVFLLLAIYAAHTSWIDPGAFGMTITSMMISGVGILVGVTLLSILLTHDAGRPRH